MIVNQAVYVAGARGPCGDLSDELAELRRAGDPTSFLWIGLLDPTEAEFAAVNDELRLHPLAVEDAVTGDQRAKLERYDETTFVVLKTLRYIEATSDIETGELMLFLGDHFVVTVRRGNGNPLAEVRADTEARPELLTHGPRGVLYAVMDSVVDTYLRIDAEVGTDVDEIEQSVFSDENVRVDSSAVYRLKREILEFRRAAVPLGAVVAHLLDPHGPVTDTELRHRFRDVGDHLQQVNDHVESYDRMLTDVLNAHLAQISVQQNSDMRKISAWVAMAAVPTMIAGIYGMNFEHMPELDWTYGYPLVLALMATICFTLYRAFKRSGWL